MKITLRISNQSRRKYLYRRDVLKRIVERICRREHVSDSVEVSVLFCDDACIRQLNKKYRGIDRPTDVMAFAQEPVSLGGWRVLGDIVISLETVERRYPGDVVNMRNEVCLLFCHGMLHLLGYDHRTRHEKETMMRAQAEVLGVSLDAAWRQGKAPKRKPGTRSKKEGVAS